MRAFRFYLSVIVVSLIVCNMNYSMAQYPYGTGANGVQHNLYGNAGYGYTATGFHSLRRSIGGEYFPAVPCQCKLYQQSYFQYSPLCYSTDPCAQWTRRGWLWDYTPTLIPPKPNEHFRCCHNCGLCTPETPCCPLCNLNGCCDRERAIEAGEDIDHCGEYVMPSVTVQNGDIPVTSVPSEQLNSVPQTNSLLVPTPTAVPSLQENQLPTVEPVSAPAEITAPADTAQPASQPTTAQAGTLKLSQVSYSQPSVNTAPSTRHSKIDVRSSRGVILTIWAPNQAKVYINGVETKKVGSKRTFASLNLKPGLRYQYVIDAVVEKDGKTYSESQTITVKAGDVKTVAFAFSELNVIPAEYFENPTE